MKRNYLKITVEVVDWEKGSEGMICQERRMYPLDHVDTSQYHTFMTYEFLEMMKNLHRRYQEPV